MTTGTKLFLVKLIHTLIWLFFNVVIFYMLYAVLAGKIDIWLWIGYGLFLLEALVLWRFQFICPLTLVARKYSDSTLDNFDIFIPLWIARHNKLIYSLLLLLIAVLTVYKLLR